MLSGCTRLLRVPLLVLMLLATWQQPVWSQIVKAEKIDTAAAHKKPVWAPVPKRAGLYAALLPGLGQIYNHQYWKLPIVYGGLSVAGYFVVRNTKDYNSLRRAYIGRINNSFPTDQYVGVYDLAQLKQLQDDANRTLNMTLLFTGLGYALQILDAVTSAHLRNFDISRDISMQMQPVIYPGGAGLGLVVNLRPRSAQHIAPTYYPIAPQWPHQP